MNSKKVTYILIAVIIVLLIVFVILKWPKEKKEEISEYIPEQEITESQARQTLVTLYYCNSETGELLPEARLIDAKELIQNPYKTLVELLIAGPKNEKVKANIPQGTIVNSAELQGDMVILDLSKEFISGVKLGEEEEKKIINSIVNTLVELTEVNSVKILIDGEGNREFEDGAINFKEPFTKETI